MTFRTKTIFLADDDPKQRNKVRTALEAQGHHVVLEAKNGDEARSFIAHAQELGVDVAVLDCKMPKETDGPEIAGMLNDEIPNLLVVSISTFWQGSWKDPNFRPDQPFSKQFESYDENGRFEFRGPDFYAEQTDWDLNQLALVIGEMEFSVRNEKMLSVLEDMTRNDLERG